MTTAGDPSVLAVAFLIARVRQRARRRAARSWLDDVPGPAAAAVRALAATRAEWEPASELQAARASGKQVGAVIEQFGQLGVTDRELRLQLTGAAIGRHVSSSTELTQAEAGALLRALQRAEACGQTDRENPAAR